MAHTSVHENYFSVHKICLGVDKTNFETYTGYFWIVDEEKNKNFKGFFENIALDYMRKLYIRIDRFFIL